MKLFSFILLSFLTISLSFGQSKNDTMISLKKKFSSIEFFGGDTFYEMEELSPCLISMRIQDKKHKKFLLTFLVKSNWKIEEDVDNRYIQLVSSKGFGMRYETYVISSKTISFNTSEKKKLMEIISDLKTLASFCDD